MIIALKALTGGGYQPVHISTKEVKKYQKSTMVKL